MEEAAIGAVRILFESLNHSGFEGVLFDVAHQGIEIGFVGHIPGFEPSLPEMPYPIVFFVEVDGVVHIELAHEFREIARGGFDEQMVVVRHQAVVVQSDPLTLQGVAHQRFEVFIVACLFEDDSSLHSPVDDMIIARYLETRFSRHDFLPPCSIAQEGLGYHYHLTPFFSLSSNRLFAMAESFYRCLYWSGWYIFRRRR